jgi:hypothetical protein
MEMIVKTWKEKKYIIISSEKYGITTQGLNLKEAILNFQDAFLTCISDPDWRNIHSISDSEYAEIVKEQENKKNEQPLEYNNFISRLNKDSEEFGIRFLKGGIIKCQENSL